MTTLLLNKSIKAHGEEVSELTFREPTTEDVIELGLPTLIVQSGDGAGIEIRQQVVARYVSKLAAIPLGAVKSLSLHDFSACQGVVMGFFGEQGGG